MLGICKMFLEHWCEFNEKLQSLSTDLWYLYLFAFENWCHCIINKIHQLLTSIGSESFIFGFAYRTSIESKRIVLFSNLTIFNWKKIWGKTRRFFRFTHMRWCINNWLNLFIRLFRRIRYFYARQQYRSLKVAFEI